MTEHKWSTKHTLSFLVCVALLPGASAESAAPIQLAGAKVEIGDYQGPAQLSVRSPKRFQLVIDVTPNAEKQPLTLGIQLAASGRETWPYNDVEVRDSAGRALPVRRAGIQWQDLFLTVPAKSTTYTVHAVEPPRGRPRLLPEEQRSADDPATGLKAGICKWPHGRQAALSIRFDDSHRTHLSKAIPILREYGFRGTFMVNPGKYPPGSRRRSAFDDQRSEWEAVARQGDQEFANHTAHHRGAKDDEDMEREIGEACETIWQLFPDRSRLLALNLGGGTHWTTTKTLRYYLDKYHLFDASSGSLGMDDVYGNRVAAFRVQLRRNTDRAGWCRIHYHSIGDGEAASEANFRAALDTAKEHEAALWVAGMADIHKYQTERAGATLSIEESDTNRVVLQLSCSTDPQLYDQPLTLQVALPESWPLDKVTVTNADSQTIPARPQSTAYELLLQFEVPPVTSELTLRR
jgi:polysaccharide deacetylase